MPATIAPSPARPHRTGRRLHYDFGSGHHGSGAAERAGEGAAGGNHGNGASHEARTAAMMVS